MKRNINGRFIKGIRYNPKTEFKKGQHWRKKKPFWDRDWLYKEYSIKCRSAENIAKQFNVTENNILFWLKKHKIQTRLMTEIRNIKHWGLSGKKNGMYGRRGILNPNWKGGLTPHRQQSYSRAEWRKLRKDLFKRDKNCRICGSIEKLEIHHIEPLSQSPLLLLDIGNVILLCNNCHKKLKGKELRWRKKLYRLINQ